MIPNLLINRMSDILQSLIFVEDFLPHIRIVPENLDCGL